MIKWKGIKIGFGWDGYWMKIVYGNNCYLKCAEIFN